jgi:hypothetical protein
MKAPVLKIPQGLMGVLKDQNPAMYQRMLLEVQKYQESN